MIKFSFRRNGDPGLVTGFLRKVLPRDRKVDREDAAMFFKIYGSIGEDAYQRFRAGKPTSGQLPSAVARATSLGVDPETIEACRRAIVGED